MYTHVDNKLQKLNLLFNILYFLQESGSLMFILQWTKGVSLRAGACRSQKPHDVETRGRKK